MKFFEFLYQIDLVKIFPRIIFFSILQETLILLIIYMSLCWVSYSIIQKYCRYLPCRKLYSLIKVQAKLKNQINKSIDLYVTTVFGFINLQAFSSWPQDINEFYIVYILSIMYRVFLVNYGSTIIFFTKTSCFHFYLIYSPY